jgi:cytochrome c-type biogenesis protein
VSAAALLTAAAAGTLSFLSPCVLPVLPGYLALLGGLQALELPEQDDGAAARRRRLARNAVLFCAGFSAVFVLLGLTSTLVGAALVRHHAVLTRVAGGLVLLMALHLAGSLVLRSPALYREFRPRAASPAVGAAAAPVAGMAFALGWTPCFGPVLGSVLAVAATQGRAAAGAALLAAYSAGLAGPFLVTGVLYGRLAAGLRRLRRVGPAVTVATAVVLAGLGVLLVLDQLDWVTTRVAGA